MTPRRRIAHTHYEWLSLVDVSGSFLSEPVLLDVFQQGIPALDTPVRKRVRAEFARWQDATEGADSVTGAHRRWVNYVLDELLALEPDRWRDFNAMPDSCVVRLADHGQTLKADRALVDDATAPATVRLLVWVFPSNKSLDTPETTTGKWKVSPTTKMDRLLRESRAQLGLVTNGEDWRLVYAPEQGTTTTATWSAQGWVDEPLTAAAFVTLLGHARFFGVVPTETLEGMLVTSATRQTEVTDRLGKQVRRAVEQLIRALDRADEERGRALLKNIGNDELFEAALVFMMRLVFLMYAEENLLLRLGEPLWDDNYAVSTLYAKLREDADRAGEEVLERRCDAWDRLLATFRAVQGGIEHADLRLPAYGGNLFDPDRFPFLEGCEKSDSSVPVGEGQGASATPMPVSNRTVLELLEALQFLTVDTAHGREIQRVSYRALDIEQIGGVYEGLLDHCVKRAGNEPVLALAGSHEPEVVITELERRNGDALIEFLVEQTGRSESALRKALTNGNLEKEAALTTWCRGDAKLIARIRPFTALVRDDGVILPGACYMTLGTTRRSTGTHYTPKSLTQPIVRTTLLPLVYERVELVEDVVAAGFMPADRDASPSTTDDKPKVKWVGHNLKPPRDLLALKVCDMAMGSGALLVQTCRFLGDLLVEAWEQIEAKQPEVRITPYGEPSQGDPAEELIPADRDERVAYARRLVADRCLYGVDKNPLAVEMAKLSLWLITLAKDKPFTFLDHALRCGDSLVGVDVKQLNTWSLDRKGSGAPILEMIARRDLDDALDLRRQLARMPTRTLDDVRRKERMQRACEEKMQRLKLAGDLLLAPSFAFAKHAERAAERKKLQALFVALQTPEMEQQLRQRADKLLAGQSTFHWPLEFAEVFLDDERSGFDAFVGNPPFLGGQRISTTLGASYLRYLREGYPSSSGTADLCAFFFLRAFGFLRKDGNLGLLATNTIAQGDTREAGLDYIVSHDGTIYDATPSMPWPGLAAVYVSVLHIHRGKSLSNCRRNGTKALHISALLNTTESIGAPRRLVRNGEKSFIGSYVLGIGFILQPEEARKLIERDSSNREVLFPYMNGDDINANSDQSPSRWVINFCDWPLSKTECGKWANADEKQRRQWLQTGVVPKDYPGPVASEYPTCLSIVEKLVKPQRYEQKDQFGRKFWWRFLRHRPELHEAVKDQRQALMRARVSEHHMLVFTLTQGVVWSEQVVVFALDGLHEFGVLQSYVHEAWARTYCSSLETRMRYTPVDCFETFPFATDPTSTQRDAVAHAGEAYYAHRQQMMTARQLGLTKTYNLFHNPQCNDANVKELRRLHREMDTAVLAAYGWTDLQPQYDYRGTGRDRRYTWDEATKTEVLRRLLELNHEIAAQEAADSEAQPPKQTRAAPKKPRAAKTKASTGQGQLIGG